MVTRAPETAALCGSVTLTVSAVFWAKPARAAVESRRRTATRRKRTEILLCTRKGLVNAVPAGLLGVGGRGRMRDASPVRAPSHPAGAGQWRTEGPPDSCAAARE